MKILVNSYPRSGTTTFVNALISACQQQRGFGIEEFFHNDSWICKSHLPAVFLGTYPKDTSIITIVRHPLDAITSNAFRWSNGHTGNIIQGKVVIDNGQIRTDDYIDDDLKRLIDHQIEQYVSYIVCYLKNKENILAISYEDTQNNIRKSVDLALPNTDNLDYSAAQYMVDNPPQPTKEKTKLYFAIREYVQLSKRYQDALGYYLDAIRYLV